MMKTLLTAATLAVLAAPALAQTPTGKPLDEHPTTAESAFNPNALSRAGASGLMQLMPDTARRYGVRNIFDPVENVHGGVRYLKDLLAMFNGDMKLALAGYNAGENAVIRAGNRVPPYPETQNYVPKVIDIYHRFRARPG